MEFEGEKGVNLQFDSIYLPRQSSNGRSRDRVQALVLSKGCKCRAITCFSKFRSMMEDLMQFLQLFWGMTKLNQDKYVTASFCNWQISVDLLCLVALAL